jgi:hypothetical protein
MYVEGKNCGVEEWVIGIQVLEIDGEDVVIIGNKLNDVVVLPGFTPLNLCKFYVMVIGYD